MLDRISCLYLWD